jgi:hypothetical protein
MPKSIVDDYYDSRFKISDDTVQLSFNNRHTLI